MGNKNLFLTIAATLATVAAVAQTDGFSYQAVIRDAKGELVKTQNVGLQLPTAQLLMLCTRKLRLHQLTTLVC